MGIIRKIKKSSILVGLIQIRSWKFSTSDAAYEKLH
jgi:hypothetical protein